MAIQYRIHPALGIARVGNSDTEFYLAPDAIGGLPIECDQNGNTSMAGGSPKPVEHFKDDEGRMKRQGARFRIFAYDDTKPGDAGQEVTLDDPRIQSMEWTVHLANKKAIWYPFMVYVGDVMFPKNTYQDNGVTPRNSSVTGPDRQKLIIDPGPRTVSKPNSRVAAARSNIPADYPHGSFPTVKDPYPIDQLGEILTDEKGRLIVLGGYGHAAGDYTITVFTGADGWYDDISDGPVTCTITLKDGDPVSLQSWVTVAAPKFAPELVNIVTLDDIMFDVGVRYMSMVPGMYDGKTWNSEYLASFERDILPIAQRIRNYLWVANVPSMAAFAAPPFDLGDPSEANRANRENYLRYFRRPPEMGDQEAVLMAANQVPLMPNNSGTNSNFNLDIEKFLALTETQYFLLKQWAAGKFSRKADANPSPIHQLDRATVGNCVGSPMCPGVELTWSTRNPKIYATPYCIKHRYDESHYRVSGLSMQDYDETISGEGCEPGDLTKRMSTPWQADLFQCSVQHVNFTEPDKNVDEHYLPIPPTYFVYWWPPQSPMQVISGAMTEDEQQLAGVDAGVQVAFQRGINSYAEMIVGWSYMGFVLNQNTGPDRQHYPYFVEKQRNHEQFIVGSVAVGDPSNVVSASDTTFQPVWFMKNRNARKKPNLLHRRNVRST